MPSDLAKQLRQIQQQDQALGGPSQSFKYRPSFLFDPNEAVQYDAQSIYDLAMTGLNELQQLDPMFLKFQPILFSSQSLDLDRALLTNEENMQIDDQIRAFLRYLSPYFLERPAHKVLEWLIRKYRVNEMNVPALVECILPYHETPHFVRMVQILFFKDDDRWGFLFDVKKNAKEINRSYLAQRCLADRTILQEIFKGVQWHAENSSEGKKTGSQIIQFFTCLVLEYNRLLKKIELTDTAFLLPFVLSSVKTKRCPDLQMAGYMIFIELASKAPLSSEVIGEVLLSAAKFCAETIATECILFVAQVLRINASSKVPNAIFENLAKIPTIHTALDKAAKSFEINAFMKVFLEAMPDFSLSSSSDYSNA